MPTTAPTQSSGDDCNHLLDMSAVGNARSKLLINNNTKGPVTLTMGWSTKNPFGQCGYLSWSNIPQEFEHHGLHASNRNGSLLLGVRLGSTIQNIKAPFRGAAIA